MKKILCQWAVMLCAWAVSAHAQAEGEWTNPADQWKTVGPERGTVLIVGGGADDSAARRFLELVGGPDAPLVVIPTAGEGEKLGEQNYAYVKLKELGAKDIVILHTLDRKIADSEAFVAPLKRAKGVWVSGGAQVRLARAYLHTRTHQELFNLLDRGGVFAGNSAGASIQGSYLYGGQEQKEGFGFVRNTAIGQHYVRRSRVGSVSKILAEHPELLGIGIDEEAAIEVQGNRFTVLGDSKVVICNPKAGETENPPHYLYPGESYDLAARQGPPPRMAAAEKWSGAHAWTDPGANWITQGPPEGRLLLSGGEASPETLARFVQLAGGPGAPLVVLSAGSLAERQSNEKIVAELTRQGAKNVTFLHTIDRDEANATAFAAPLAKARGVWIGGGAKWKLADSYRQTLVHRELFDLVGRGGVVGGNGAGAAILAAELCDAGYRWNEGYDLLRKTVIWEEPLDEKSTASLQELQAREPDLRTVALKPGASFLFENGQIKTLENPATPSPKTIAVPKEEAEK
ncbi:MAG: Type 1 glutamine amidotransferase-like domain-containing protein [Chthoniobacter sp.]